MGGCRQGLEEHQNRAFRSQEDTGDEICSQRKRPYKPMSCPDLRRGAEGCVLGEGSDSRAPPDKSS